MKKLLSILFALALILVACGGDTETEEKEEKKETEVSTYEDGYYHAMAAVDEKGWATVVMFEYKDGMIDTFEFDAYNLKTGSKKSKFEMSEAGEYNLPEGAVGTYHEQAQAIMDYVVENNGLEDVEFDSEGNSDAISGATIDYSDLGTLIDEALKAGPVEEGDLEDGVMFGKADTDDKGWTEQVAYFVDNGIIIGAHVDATKVEGEETSYKSDLSVAGEYKLPDGSAAPLFEQFMTIEEEILADQADFGNIEVDEEGKTDAISGATISLDGFIKAFNEAK